MSAPGPQRGRHLGFRRLPRPVWKAFAWGAAGGIVSLRGCSFLSCWGCFVQLGGARVAVSAISRRA